MSYGYSVRLTQPFTAELVQRVRDVLKENGFGILSEIDIAATMLSKLGAEMEDYVILGACNPPLAHRALEADRSIGLMLPCNVTVRADGPDATIVEALDPQVMVTVAGHTAMGEVADHAGRLLRTALDTLVDASGH